MPKKARPVPSIIRKDPSLPARFPHSRAKKQEVTELVLDLAFFHRVYRTTLILMALGALLCWQPFGSRGVLGWLIGSGLSLFMLAGVEWSIVRFLQPNVRSTRGLVGVFLAKMLAATAILVFAFIAALNRWIHLPWVLIGFAMPHLVVGLKLLGQKVRDLTAVDRPSDGNAPVEKV